MFCLVFCVSINWEIISVNEVCSNKKDIISCDVIRKDGKCFCWNNDFEYKY